MQEADVAVGGYESPSSCAAYSQSAHQLQESQSVFESGPLRKQACDFKGSREPACLVAICANVRKEPIFSAKRAI